MNKNDLITILLKEIKEMEVLTNGLSDFEKIPNMMFQLAESKIDNIKNLYQLLSEECVMVTSIEEKISDHKQEIIAKEESVSVADVTEPISQKTIESEIIVTEQESVQIVQDEQNQSIVIESVPNTIEENKELLVPIVVSNDLEVDQKKEKTQVNKQNIVERFSANKSSLNEKLSAQKGKSLDKNISTQKIVDLKKSIHLNDRFRFQKDLFKGNASLMNQTLDILNESADKNEAMDFISSFEWEESNQTVQDFLELINRRFSN